MKNKKLFLTAAFIFLAAGCNPFSKSLPAGVVKSVNGGVDWQFANTASGSPVSGLSTLSISKLAFDPQNRQTVFAASYTGGMYKSEDAAGSWANILSDIYVYDFAISPIDSKTIYAAGFYNADGRALKTTDGGASWNQIYDEETPSDAVRSIALNPANPNELVIGTTVGDVIKSSDGGQTWLLLKSFNDQVNRVLWQDNSVYVLLKTKGLFASTDSGATFTQLTSSLANVYGLGGLSYSSSPIENFSQVYVDFDSQDLIYITTNKGLYKTIDGGKTWTFLPLPVSAQDSAARAIAVAPGDSSTVFTSVGSTVYKSLDAGQTWQTQGLTTAGFINYILIDPQLPQIVYAGVYSTQ